MYNSITNIMQKGLSVCWKSFMTLRHNMYDVMNFVNSLTHVVMHTIVWVKLNKNINHKMFLYANTLQPDF